MILYYVLGGVVLVAVALVGLLFYFLNKESSSPSEIAIVPITNPQDVIGGATHLDAEDRFKQRVDELDVEKYKKRIEEVEEELRLVSEKGVEQAQANMTLIDTLTKENQELRESNSSVDRSQSAQLADTEEKLRKSYEDNDFLKAKIEEVSAKNSQFAEEMVRFRQAGEEELARVQAMVDQMKSTQASSMNVSLELNGLKDLNEQLKREIETLRANDEMLKESNRDLTQKNQTLQYELTRNRAQVSGMEKICENYKSQLGRFYELQNK